MTSSEATDVREFMNSLRERGYGERGAKTVIARAPGRLDVMGGIADYSGSLVLQRPIAEATFVACQTLDRPVLELISFGRRTVEVPFGLLVPESQPISYEAAQKHFRQVDEDRWAAYVAGVFIVLMHELNVHFTDGARIVISSEVPEGKGVASSAALEVAVMQAVTGRYNIAIEPRDVALLCQKVENLVAGAPCGVMDQMTSVFGDADALTSLHCQPAELQEPVRIPEGMTFWGLDSGERHSVSGSDYASVRAGAFMGLRMIAQMDGTRGRYLANISPADFESQFMERLPEEMSGEKFLARYVGTSDTVTAVAPERTYKVRQPTAHPVYEHHRVQTFRRLLLEPPGEEQRIRLGELMYESHASYSACGLGSKGTDAIVRLVRAEGREKGLYGARITGGGSGGTVAILGRRNAQDAIARVANAYAKISGYQPYIFSGSSDGAARFGTVHLIQ